MNKLIVLLAALSTPTFAGDLNAQFYGYIEGYVEKVEKSPTRSGGTSTTGGTSTRQKNAHEFDIPRLNVMMKASKGNYSAFLNVDASGSSLNTQNAWFEAKVKGNLLKYRIGKLYRPFGLYNERLDATPTYIGIEAPELFDTDHLLVTRTTNFMVHGQAFIGGNSLRYSLTTGNDERFSSQVPVGGDLRYTFLGEKFEVIVGSSFYFSGLAKPSVAQGSGSPAGGIANWMRSGKYDVLGLYTEVTGENLIFQAAYFNSSQEGTRNGTFLRSIDTSSLNQNQINRLCNGNMSTCTDSTANFDVKTWYVRAGWVFQTSFFGEVTPYVQWDYYENPETIAKKADGGDAEAGLADDGKFNKQTLGVVFRPDLQLAIKLDASNHSQKVDGKNTNYAEVRGSFSYIWSL